MQPDAPLDVILATWCLSDCEGCICGKLKGHEPPHRCPAEGCGDEWTDEDAAEWHAQVRAEIQEYRASGILPPNWTST